MTPNPLDSLPPHDVTAVERFRAFLRIPTISTTGPTDGSYAAAVKFLKEWGEEIGLSSKVVSLVENKPILILSLLGKRPELPSLMLNSHYDVVPAIEGKWDVDPFAATLLPNGDIISRGTQDMKCVCIAHLEAISRLKKKEVSFERTIHLTYMPDEEIGGIDGMAKFVEDESFKALNVGLALDEGLANPSPKFTLFNGERAGWWGIIKAVGPTGHGSRFIQDTAIGKISGILSRMLEFRTEQEALLSGGKEEGCGCKHALAKKLGDVTSVNVTVLKAGLSADGGETFAYNVVPPVAELYFDIRMPPDTDEKAFERDILKGSWIGKENTERGVTYSFLVKSPVVPPTDVEPDNVWWQAIDKTFKDLGFEIEVETFPAASDIRYIRAKGIACYGFSPMRNTEILLHDHNERLNVSVFLEGISVFESLIPALANVPSEK